MYTLILTVYSLVSPYRKVSRVGVLHVEYVKVGYSVP